MSVSAPLNIESVRQVPVSQRPLDLVILAADDPWQARLRTLAWGLVALGVLLRLSRYLLNFPLWGDELMLAQNFLDRGYMDLTRPLGMVQVAPLAYLWIELTSIKLFGFSEYSLRLCAMLSGVASVPLFYLLARRLCDNATTVLAVGVFAVSYYPIRHAAECKPYASDLTASLVLVLLAVCWWQDQANRRWLWGLCVAGPLAVAVSYPTVFVAGGISLALVAAVWQRRDARTWIAFVAYNVFMTATFLGFLVWVSSTQYADAREFMVEYWQGGFPPAHPVALARWLLVQHTGEMMAYPVGDDRFGSVLTFVCFATGVVMLVRRKQLTLAALVLAPLALTLVAAALRRYPYGGARLSQYYAALACLTVGFGGACLISWLKRADVRRAVFAGSVGVFALMGTAILMRDMAHPYKYPPAFEHRGFARWFWAENLAEADVVCVRNDLGHDFFGGQRFEYYLCNQRTYSPPHRSGNREVDLATLGSDRPLRCVVYHELGAKRDAEAFDRWMEEMQSRFKLTDESSYQVRLAGPREDLRVGTYEVYEFRAKAAAEDVAEKSPVKAALQ